MNEENPQELKRTTRMRLDSLVDLGDRKMIKHEISPEGKIRGIHVSTIIDYATKQGLEAFEHNGNLYIAMLQHV